MMSSTDRFISRFHSLTGEKIGERRKNLFKLLNEAQKSLQYNEQIDFSLLQPKTPLEETFKVEALIFFKRTLDIFEVLKSENPTLIKKVLRVSHMFLAPVLKDITGDDFAKTIFPQLSFNTKIKLLNKLATCLKDTKQAEEFFQAVLQNYGLHLATKLLPCCSAEFIVQSLKSHRIEFTPAQLIIIVEKYPALSNPVLELLNEQKGKLSVAAKYKKIFVRLAKQDVQLFSSLNEKYKPDFRLGRRATKRFISDKTKAIADSKHIYKLLQTRQVTRSLGQDYSKFYFNLFPTSIAQYKEEFESALAMLEHISPNVEKINLLLSTFKAIYGNELWQHPTLVTPKVIEMMSPDDREIWMESHSKPAEISEEQWISFMKTDKSIPLLKEKILLTANVKFRSQLIVWLVASCKVNDDFPALGDVCEYVATRHRNDHYSLRQDFLMGVKERFDLSKLEERHWVHLNDLVQLGIVNNEYQYGYCYFLTGYMQYALTRNLPIREQLAQWVRFRYWRLVFKEPKHEKQCLLMMSELIALCSKDEELDGRYIDYLCYVDDWNHEHPTYQISLLSRTIPLDRLKASLERHHELWMEEDIIGKCAEENFAKTEQLGLLHALFACKNTYMSGNVVKFLLINEPLFVLRNIDLITKALLKTKCLRQLPSIWKFCRNYSHLGIPEKIVQICLAVFHADDDLDVNDPYDPNELARAVTTMSYVMNGCDFINLSALYYPPNLTMDIKTKEERRTCKIHKAISASARNVIPSYLALDTILQFSKGDYLALAQKSLYAFALNVAENKLAVFLEELSSRAVSVRKHSIYLTFKICSRSQKEALIKQLKDDNNSSIRKSLFKVTFRFFANSPDDYTWSLLQEQVKALNVNDNEAFKILAKCKRVPTAYIERYVVFAWNVIAKLPSSKDTEEKLCEILDAAVESATLPQQFCADVIGKYLFQPSESSFQAKIRLFTCRYVIQLKWGYEQEERLRFAFDILKRYVTLSWSDSKASKLGHESVFSFIQTFCADFLEKKCRNVELFSKFLELWEDFLKPHEALNEYLYLNFTLTYVKYTTLPEIGENLVELYDLLLETNGSIIIENFSKSLKMFAGRFLLSELEEEAEENRFTLLKNLIENNGSANRFMVVIFLLPEAVPTVESLKVRYNGIIESLLKEKEPCVQIYLHNYFHSLE